MHSWFAIASAVGGICVLVLGTLATLFGTGWLTYKAIDWIARYFRVMDGLWEFLVLYLRHDPRQRAEYKNRKALGQKLVWRLVREDGTDWVR